MPTITTHDHFMACLKAFLQQVGKDTGMSYPANQNMLQFVLGLGADVGPRHYKEAPPLPMELKASSSSPMKTVIHVAHDEFHHEHAQRLVEYFNGKYGAEVACVLDTAYLKGSFEEVEVFSGVLLDELKQAIVYQETLRGSLMAGVNALLHLPVSDMVKAELKQPHVKVDFVPNKKLGWDYQELVIEGVSEACYKAVVAAIQLKYGNGSVRHGG